MRPGEAAAALAALAALFCLAVLDDLRGVRRTRPPLEAGAGPDARAIDINRAPWWRLALLPGIGPVGAKRIVARRERAGPFRSLEGLRDVPGIRAGLPAELRGRAFAGPGEAGGDDDGPEPVPTARALRAEG